MAQKLENRWNITDSTVLSEVVKQLTDLSHAVAILSLDI